MPIPRIRRMLHQQLPARYQALPPGHGRRSKTLMDLPRPRHSRNLISPRPNIRRLLHFPRHEVLLRTERRSHFLELLGAGCAEAVPGADDPGAVVVILPVEFLGGVWGGDGAGEHGEHFGGVAAGAEDDEEVGWFGGVAAAVAEGFVAGGVQDEGEAVEGGGDYGEEGYGEEGDEDGCESHGGRLRC